MGLLQINESCPHCLKDNAVLICIAESQYKEHIYSLVFECKSCSRMLVAEVMTSVYGGPSYVAKNSNFPVIANTHPNFRVINLYPKIKKHKAPDNIPEKSERFYIEAKENHARGNFETCVMLVRKVLDISTKEILGEEAKKETLNQRISILRAKDLITEQMKDWAHIVRIESNDSVHSDEEFTEAEAAELLNFTEIFLMYSFTLPAMVEDKKSKSNP